MKNNSSCSIRSNCSMGYIGLALCISLMFPAAQVFGTSPETPEQSKIIITAAQYHCREQSDTGEIRISLNNTSNAPLSINQCSLSKVINSEDKKPPEIKYLYAKLSPPKLPAGGNGELLIKLNKTLPKNSRVNCIIEDSNGKFLQTSIQAEQTPIWISYIGFSEALDEIYIYFENKSQKPLQVKLIEVAGVKVGDNYRSINSSVDANDKGCLIYKLPGDVKSGQYIDIAVTAESEGKKWQTRRIVRTVKRFPLILENGSGNLEWGLDSKKFFATSKFAVKKIACVQNMMCPAHNYDSHEDAAKKFIDNRNEIFSKAPHLLTQMWICRSDKPQAWFKFGALADVSVMTTVLPGSLEGDSFCPFFRQAVMAKKSAEPGRYFACIPIFPESALFLQESYTSDELKFLVYCAIASGAKGLLYRGGVFPGDLIYDAFIKLNNELQNFKTQLIISEPIDWAFTTDENFIAKSLLCGDKTILIFVFDRRYFSKNKRKKFYTPAFAKTVKPTKIEVKIPDLFTVSDIKSQNQSLMKQQWNYQPGQVDFTVQISDSVQIYKIDIAQSSSKTTLGGNL